MAKYKYLRLNRKDYRLWDWRDIDGHCPKCGKTDIEYMSVSVQFGFREHKLTSYGRCKECGHHFSWQETTRRASAKIHAQLQAFLGAGKTHDNETAL